MKKLKQRIQNKNDKKIIWFDEKIKNEENQNNFKELKSFFKTFGFVGQYEELN